MKSKNPKKCPKCGKNMHRNDIRNGNQRWRCSNKSCRYNFTENLKTPNIKSNAVSFFYDLMSNASNHKAKLTNDLLQELIRKTKYESKKEYKISIEHINIKEGIEINANSFIVEMDKNELKLLCLRYHDKNLLFKRETGKFIIKEHKETEADQNDYNDYGYNYSRKPPTEEDFY